jgi:hypothetical protein
LFVGASWEAYFIINKELEHLTGGIIKAGFHEVVIVDATLKQLENQKSKSRPLWRISSTVFFHLQSDKTLEPLVKFRTKESVEKYPSQLVGEQVQRELGFLELAQK